MWLRDWSYLAIYRILSSNFLHFAPKYIIDEGVYVKAEIDALNSSFITIFSQIKLIKFFSWFQTLLAQKLNLYVAMIFCIKVIDTKVEIILNYL